MPICGTCETCGYDNTVDGSCIVCMYKEISDLKKECKENDELIERIRNAAHDSEDARDFILWVMEQLPN